MNKISHNVYRNEKGELFTLTKDKKSIYGEKIIFKENKFYRLWTPFRSKLSASLHRKLKSLNIKEDSIVLYIGCASGTTVSHISDIVTKGMIFAIDISPKEIMQIYFKLSKRNNVSPILADARNPAGYKNNLYGLKADVLIQDIACKDQVEILIKNSKEFLKKNGEIYFSLKTKSISQIKSSTKILEDVKQSLLTNFILLKSVNLRKYEDNHWLLHLRKNI